MAWFHKVAPSPSKDEGMLFLHLKVHISFDSRKTLTFLFISSPVQECILMTVKRVPFGHWPCTLYYVPKYLDPGVSLFTGSCIA